MGGYWLTCTKGSDPGVRNMIIGFDFIFKDVNVTAVLPSVFLQLSNKFGSLATIRSEEVILQPNVSELVLYLSIIYLIQNSHSEDLCR